MAAALTEFERLYADRDADAKAWKQAGGEIIGYICDHVPTELVAAAGFYPYRISADPRSGSELLQKYAVPFIQQPLPAPGFVRSMEHLLFDGRFDFLDALVVPNGRKAIQAFYRDLLVAHRAYPNLDVPDLVYLDKAMTASFASSVFDRKQVLSFKSWLESRAGSPIGEDALRNAIQEENAGRRLLGQVAQLRAQKGVLSGLDALHIFGSFFWTRRTRHNELLRQLLAEVDVAERKTDHVVKVFVGGSPIDDDRLYRFIEDEGGAIVVGEDHCWGSRCVEHTVDDAGDPFAGISSRFHRQPACSIRFPIQQTTATAVRRMVASAPDAAVFCVYEDDVSQMAQVPEQVDACRRLQVPVLHLAAVKYEDPLADGNGRALRSFLAEIGAAAASPAPG